MEPTRQQVIDGVLRRAHEADPRIVTSEVADRVVADLHSLEGSGHQWVTDYIDSLAAKGAAKVHADWRRRYSVPAVTKKGTKVAMPGYGSVREADDDGEVTYVQLAFTSMTLPQVRKRRDQLAKTRDTLSAEVRVLADLVEMMEADPSLKTAGQALAKLAA